MAYGMLPVCSTPVESLQSLIFPNFDYSQVVLLREAAAEVVEEVDSVIEVDVVVVVAEVRLLLGPSISVRLS